MQSPNQQGIPIQTLRVPQPPTALSPMCPKMCPNEKTSRWERVRKSLIYKDGGPGIRTPKRSRAAVFKTAALPIRSSPPERVT